MKIFYNLLITILATLSIFIYSCSTDSSTTTTVDKNLEYSDNLYGVTTTGILKIDFMKYYKDTIIVNSLSQYPLSQKLNFVSNGDKLIGVYSTNDAQAIISFDKGNLEPQDTVLISNIDSILDASYCKNSYYAITEKGLFMYNSDSAVAGYIDNHKFNKLYNTSYDTLIAVSNNSIYIFDASFNKLVDSVNVANIIKTVYKNSYIYSLTSIDSINYTISKFDSKTLTLLGTQNYSNIDDFGIIKDSSIVAISYDSLSTTLKIDTQTNSFNGILKSTTTEKNLVLYNSSEIYILKNSIFDYSYFNNKLNILSL